MDSRIESLSFTEGFGRLCIHIGISISATVIVYSDLSTIMGNHTYRVVYNVLIMVVCAFTKGVSSGPCRPVLTHVLWCNGSEVNQAFIDMYLKDTITGDLTEIHITNGNFSELPANAFSDCASNSSAKLNKLTKLVLSNNNITKIHGKTFHCMPNLQKLFLDRNRWSLENDVQHAGYLNNLPNLVELDFTSTFTVSSAGLHIIRLGRVLNNSSLTKLETLRLGYNDMQFVPTAFGKALCTMDSLKHINLQGNSLYRLEFTDCFQKSKQLEKIDLSHNALSTLDKRSMDVFDFMTSSNKRVNLTVNLLYQQWSCDCNIKPFKAWIDTTKVHLMGREKYRCHDGANFNKTIFHLSDAEMACKTDDSVQPGVVVMIVLFVIIAVALIAALVLYRNRLTSFAHGVRKSLTRESHVQYSSVDNAPLTAEA